MRLFPSARHFARVFVLGAVLSVIAASCTLALGHYGMPLLHASLASVGCTVLGLAIGALVASLRRTDVAALPATESEMGKIFIPEQWVDQPSPLDAVPQHAEKEALSGLIATVVYDSLLDVPFSDTHDRETALATARQALLSMDHTKAILH